MNESLNIVIIASHKDLKLKFPKVAKTDGSSDKNIQFKKISNPHLIPMI